MKNRKHVQRPKKAQVEEALGKSVQLTFYDGNTLCGELHKTGEERFKNDPNLYLPKGFYTILGSHLIFRSSHVKQIEILDLAAIKKFVEGLDEECCCVCRFKDDCHGITANGAGDPLFPPCSGEFPENGSICP